MTTDLNSPEVTAPKPPALSPIELLRWAWRQLTSMRTALLLLFLLALGAVPGSVVPQQNLDPVGVSGFKADHPRLGPIYDKLGLFDVYGSVWFSAIYVLLMISLLGCVLPRLRVYWRALRAQPPKAPRNLSRLPAYATGETTDSPQIVLERAQQALRGKRYRVAKAADGAGGSGSSLGAERGYLREAGNLVFHFSIIAVLVGFAMGQLLGFKGGALIMVGQGFTNSLTQYDEFAPGSLVNTDNLAPVSFTVDDFKVEYVTSGPALGQAKSFTAMLSYATEFGGPVKTHELKVNHPLSVDGLDVFLIGYGYAPIFTIRDGNGDLAFRAPAPFLPQDGGSMTSFGVVKVPDALPDQLGFEGEFYPTYGFTDETGPFSSFPEALNPKVSLLGYYGDLGMDTGAAQNVYLLSKKNLTMFTRPDAKPDDPKGDQFRITLGVGETAELPGGKGSITLDGYQHWVRLQMSNSPGEALALGGVAVALVGLMASLFVRPRRLWVRAWVEDGPGQSGGAGGRTVVEVAGLDRSNLGEGLDADVRELLGQLRPETGTAAGSGMGNGTGDEDGPAIGQERS